MSHRIAQIESTLQQIISDVLQRRLSDPRIQGMISITGVTVSPDLTQAVVDVSVLPEERQNRTLAGIQHAAGRIHALVRPRVRMRHVPRLEFRLDDSLKRQERVFDAIDRGMERSGDHEPEEESPESS